VSQRGPFAGFWFGPYETKEEAETKGLAEILHWHARAEKLARGFRVAHNSGLAASGFAEGRHVWYVSRLKEVGFGEGHAVAGPFDSLADALDEAESCVQKDRDTWLRNEARHCQSRLEQCKLPVVLKDVRLDSFKAKTDSLADALNVACEYVAKFHLRRQGLVLCGPTGVGKTSLACAIAAGLATADHPAQARYVTVLELISAKICGTPLDVSEPDLLVLDWCGIDSTSNHKADRDRADLLAAMSSHVVMTVLETRHKDEARYGYNRPTLLVADCDRARLERSLDWRLELSLDSVLFARVRENLWRIVELECPSTSSGRKGKEVTKCQAQ
jgi:IstB-like ATP binding protein